MAIPKQCETRAPDYRRRATAGTLATLAGLMMLYGCDSADPVEQAAQEAVTQEMKESAVTEGDGTAAGPGPVEALPGSASDSAGTEDPQKP